MNEARLAGQQSVRRAIDVLFCFDGSTSSLSAAEVAERLGLNRTTTWRYLQTLVSTGLLRELGEGRFALGSRTVSLAEAYTRQWGQLEAVAGAALVRLRDAVGETAALHVRQGWSRVVVRQVESRHDLRRTYRDLGQPISLLTGSPSLAILAALPQEDRSAFVAAHAGDRREEVERIVEEAAARGYAESHGARVPDCASVAAAVRDSAGRVIGAINVTGPEGRVTRERLEEIARLVTAEAEWIGEQLSGTGDAHP